MGKITISMAIFNSYVKLPEGIYKTWRISGEVCSQIFSSQASFDHMRQWPFEVRKALNELLMPKWSRATAFIQSRKHGSQTQTYSID
jgi:hypothetical protein